MQKIRTLILTLLIFAGLVFVAQAADHGSMDHGSMDHGSMDKKSMNHGDMDHGKNMHDSMSMQGGMIMLGNSVQDGVTAMAHLKDVKAAMAKMNMKTTHHLMIMFADDATGEPIESGAVAVKVKGADGKQAPPVKLMGMQGHFGADIVLAEPGEYHFTVGTKLADGKKRQFDFSYNLK